MLNHVYYHMLTLIAATTELLLTKCPPGPKCQASCIICISTCNYQNSLPGVCYRDFAVEAEAQRGYQLVQGHRIIHSTAKIQTWNCQYLRAVPMSFIEH